MSAVAISFGQWLVCGLAAALLIDRSMRGCRLVGFAFLLGSGVAAFVLLVLSLLGIRWSAITASLILGVLTLGLWFAAARRKAVLDTKPEPSTTADRLGAVIVDLVTIALVAGHAVFATIAPVAEWDFWAIWGLKARVFLAGDGIDWAFLEDRFNLFTHPDYPLLLPLDYSWIALFSEGWSDRWLGILTTVFGVALLLIVRDLFATEFRGRMLAALATLSVASFALSPWIGMAEGPLVAFGGAGLLLLRRGLLAEERSTFAAGSVLLGLAAFTKNEGLTLVIAAVVAAILHLRTRWREVWRIWPALAIPAPWLILRTLHRLETDLTAGAMTDRAAQQLRNLPELTKALADNVPDEPLFWIAVVATVLIFARSSLDRERFLTTAVLIQVLFYVGAYVITPNDLRWHVASSWVRLLEQIAVPAGFAAVTILGQALERGSESSILPPHEQHPRSEP